MNFDACTLLDTVTDEVPTAWCRGSEQDAFYLCQGVLLHASSRLIGVEMSYKVSCSHCLFNNIDSDILNWHLRIYCWRKEGLSRLVLQTKANNQSRQPSTSQ